jgi:hypothetical protein
MNLLNLMNIGISSIMTSRMKGGGSGIASFFAPIGEGLFGLSGKLGLEQDPAPVINPPPAYTPPPTPELKEASSMDKAKTTSNAYAKEEKRRILASLPKATKTVLDQTGATGTTKKKRLLGEGGGLGSEKLGGV